MPPKPATRRPTARRTEQAEGSASAAPEASSIQNAPSENRTQSATPGTGGRQPVQRLQSLKKRESSGSISASGRPLSNLPGEPTKPTLKYQPKKNVQRRSKEERDAMSKLEQERHNERLKEAAAIQRGRGGGRGRGAFRGRGGPVGTGGFGPQGGARRGRGGSAFGPRSYDRSQTRSVFSAGGSRPPMDYDSDDDEESGIRLSIDQIGLSDDSDSDLPQDAKGKLPARSRDPELRGLKPVRVQRIEHEDRVISVNMESSTARTDELRKKAEHEAKAAQGEEVTPEEEEEEPRIKAEPVDEDTQMPDIVPVDDDGFLPQQKVRVRRKISDPESSPVKPKAKAPEPQKVKRDPRELLRTKEEIDEYDRHLDDLAHIQELFRESEPEKSAEAQPGNEAIEPSTEKTPAAESGTDTPAEGEGEADNQENEQPEDKTAKNLVGQLFLMQFPPMTPNLTVPGSENPDPPALEAAGESEVEANNTQNDVKTEGNDVEITDVITAATDWSLPAGKVGKLNVHKSGRITMDWGGISFELDRAAMVDFVQEALIVSSSQDEPGVKKEDEQEEENRAWSMGQLCGKFTVMPNWDEML
ncbi:uncharacterized protein N7469_007326 [Penicillium citrinum]|uniref:DNA-directed RNA polymerase III RPC4 n=1 Tax=Penicillium citrinum TaxID=5077 RepID=A0A9W9NWC1_PENCI|nr:uncharacterized protein N7469_007326 [Penicillium citrinum]KAJ5227320.1 hypothetical protein N7469_007326 [Penicillium citrinum]